MQVELDAIDLQILDLMQSNARISNVDLAKELAMAPSAVLERVKKLEQKKVILQYNTAISPPAVNQKLLAFVFIKTKEGADSDAKIAASLAKVPEVQEVHIIAGEDCFFVKVRTEDTASLIALMRKSLKRIPNVLSTKTTIVLETVKEQQQLVIPKKVNVMSLTKKEASPVMIIIAFAVLYIVWGSTYFFIQKAIAHIPAFIMGAMRFIVAGILLMLWCVVKKEKLFNPKQIKHAALTGVMLLFVGTGAVIWAEKTLPSSLVGVLVASEAIWLVLLDKKNWKTNLTSRFTVTGLIIGFAGVVLLFSESAGKLLSQAGGTAGLIGFIVLVIGTISWAGGSIYSKNKSFGSSTVNSAWQMLVAGLVFLPASFLNNEWSTFQVQAVPAEAWLSVLYLVVMGSLAGYSAYVWLLSVRPVTQVSTHVYVNPLVAVLLGVLFAGEHMSGLQVIGLGVILISVLLINLSKYRQRKAVAAEIKTETAEGKLIVSATGKPVVCAD